MLIRFFTGTLRQMVRQRGLSFINLFGLSVGLAAAILILMFVTNEYSYDQFHLKKDRIKRVNLIYTNKDGSFVGSSIPAAVGPSLAEAFPEINRFCRLTTPQSGYFQYAEKNTLTDGLVYADSSFFGTFSFLLLQGDARTALSGPHRTVITRSLAQKMFGESNPIGEIIRLNGREGWLVSGVADNPPVASSIQFDALLSFETLYLDTTLFMGWNGGNQYETYLTFNPLTDWTRFSDKLPAFMDEQINHDIAGSGFSVGISFTGITDIHLNAPDENSGGGKRNLIRIFILIALFILLIACFNFTNLATASALTRSRETGIRKVLGASRSQLILRFLSEALLLGFIALGLALLIIELVQPYYNALLGTELGLYHTHTAWFIPGIIGLVALTGLVAGAYPAFYLSSFQPVKTLKGGFESVKTKSLLPKILVVVQFVIAAALLNCSWVIYNQMRFIRQFDTGFTTENVTAISLPESISNEAVAAMQQSLKSLPGVLGCGAATELPGAGVTMNGYLPEGYAQPVMIHVMDIDPGFLQTMEIPLIAGRNFEAGNPSDKQAYLVNEAFVRQFGYANPIGKVIRREGDFPIIGVVKDFHYAPLYEPIGPLILSMHPWDGYRYLVYRTENFPRTSFANSIEEVWKTQLPNEPLLSTPLDAYLQQSYTQEKQLGDIFGWLTLLAMAIAAVGLFGLSALIIRQKTKALGIRKILGASTGRLVVSTLLSFTLLVVLANLIAAIPVWLLMQHWLGQFAFVAGLSPLAFVITGVITVVIAWISVGWQALRAASIKPVDVVKYE